jgi:hypothetical protein
MFTLRLCRTPNKPSTLRIVRLLHGVGWCLGMHFCIKTKEKESWFTARRAWMKQGCVIAYRRRLWGKKRFCTIKFWIMIFRLLLVENKRGEVHYDLAELTPMFRDGCISTKWNVGKCLWFSWWNQCIVVYQTCLLFPDPARWAPFLIGNWRDGYLSSTCFVLGLIWTSRIWLWVPINLLPKRTADLSRIFLQLVEM